MSPFHLREGGGNGAEGGGSDLRDVLESPVRLLQPSPSFPNIPLPTPWEVSSGRMKQSSLKMFKGVWTTISSAVSDWSRKCVFDEHQGIS